MAVKGAPVKLLLVAGFFPPAGGVGTFRATKFVRYLPQFGVVTEVLAMSPATYSALNWPLDEGLLRQIPAQTTVHRVDIARVPFLRDAGLRWAIRLCWSVHKVMREAKPDVVMFTGDPFFPMILGPFLRLLYGCEYILDFRDPWSLAEREREERSMKMHLIDLGSRIGEWFALRWCRRAIVVSEPMYSSYVERYACIRDKFLTIPNGFDPADYANEIVDNRAAGAALYTGKFRTGQRYRDPSPLFQALKKLQREGVVIPFVHVGMPEDDAIAAAKAVGLDPETTRWEGYLPHATTVAVVKQALIGVIIGGGQRSEQTTKVFDYLATGIPILAIVPKDSNVASLLCGYLRAVIVDNDADAIACGIRSLLSDRRGQASALTHRYSREKLAEQLSVVIKSCRRPC